MFKISSDWFRRSSSKARNYKTYRALRDLDDHTLKDIGLCQSDLMAFRYGRDPRRDT